MKILGLSALLGLLLGLVVVDLFALLSPGAIALVVLVCIGVTTALAQVVFGWKEPLAPPKTPDGPA